MSESLTHPKIYTDFRGAISKEEWNDSWAWTNGVSASSVGLNDNVKLLFGTDDDASIYYNGTNLVIDPTELSGSGGSLSILGDISAVNMYIEEKLGVGALATDSSYNADVYIKKNMVDLGGDTYYGIDVEYILTGTANDGDEWFGGYISVEIPNTNNSDQSNSYIEGFSVDFRHNGQGDLDWVTGASFGAQARPQSNDSRYIYYIEALSAYAAGMDAEVDELIGASVSSIAVSSQIDTYISSFKSLELYIGITSTSAKDTDIDDAYGLHVRGTLNELSTGNVSVGNLYGAYFDNINSSGSPSVTNQYQLYIETPTRGTTNYSIYVEGGNAYFGGDVNILGDISATNLSGTNTGDQPPGGSDSQVQYNNGGDFGGANIFYDDATGFVGLIGQSSPQGYIHIGDGNAVDASIFSIGILNISTSSAAPFYFTTASNSAGGTPQFVSHRSRGTLGTPTALQDGDSMMEWVAGGYDGTDIEYVARIKFVVDGAVSGDTVPGAIVFGTGTTSINDYVTLSSDGTTSFGGDVGIGTASPDYKTHIVGELRVQSANYAGMMLLGADAGVTTVSTNVNKQARIAGVTYGNSYTMGMFSYESDSSKDEMIVGSKAGNTAVAPNQLSFYTATTKGSTGSTVRRMHFYESATILEDGFYIRRSNGWIGLGTTNPLYRFDVRTDTTYGISTQGAVNLDLVDDPTTNPTLTLTTGGSVDAGIHYYHITFTTALGETHTKSSPPSITTDVTNNAVQLSDIPVSSDPRVTGRKIYRSKAGATNDTGYYVGAINDNTTTTYLDTKADSALTGSLFMASYRPNTTSNFITVNSETAMMIDKNRTSIGIGSCGGLTGDSFITNFGFQNMNTATTPSTVVCLGSRNLINATAPSSLIAIGDLVGRLNTTGGYSIYIGSQVSYYNTTGSLNIGIGNSTLRGTSGYSQTGCLAVGYNAGRTIAGATYSSWYGYASGYTASQKLDVAYSTALGTNSWTDANYQMAYGSENVTEHKFRSGKISINGAISKPYVEKTGAYTLTASDYTVNCTANTFDITLPTAVGITGRIYNIKNTGTGTITVDGNSTETIDGELTQDLTQWDNMMIQSTGSNWIIL